MFIKFHGSVERPGNLKYKKIRPVLFWSTYFVWQHLYYYIIKIWGFP